MHNQIKLHGIPNCDTVKKARVWLQQNGIDFDFVNFKKDGITATDVSDWIAQAGLDLVINKRGTTWRKLSDEQKALADSDSPSAQLIELICAQPSLVKRPVLVSKNILNFGFKPEIYQSLLK